MVPAVYIACTVHALSSAELLSTRQRPMVARPCSSSVQYSVSSEHYELQSDVMAAW